MELIKTDIDGVVLLKPRVFEDTRGYFFESFSRRELEPLIGPVDFVQDNESRSVRGVVRGLHFQCPPFAQAKLVRCVQGSVLDVAVDIRKGSPTFGRYVAVELSEHNHLAVFIPHGFAHGFAVLSDVAVFQYKCDNYYAPQSEGGISLFDSRLDIPWPFPADKAILSQKDLHHPLLADLHSPFIYHKP